MSDLTELQKQLTTLKKGLKNKKAELSRLDKNNPSNKKRITKLNKQIASYPDIINVKEKAIAELKKNGTKASATKTQPRPIVAKRCVTTKCPPKKTDELPGGKICITIDHLDTSSAGYTTEFIVKQLLGLEAVSPVDTKKPKYKLKKPTPVTVFIQARGTFTMDKGKAKRTGNIPRQKVHHLLDAQMAMFNRLKKYKHKGVKFGVHLLGTQDLIINGDPKNKINDLKTEVQMQLDNITYLKSILDNTRLASYHGANAASVKSANDPLVTRQFDRIRDTQSASPTIVQLKKVNQQTTTQFFFHAVELKQDRDKYKVYRILLEGLQSGKYTALPY